MERLFALLGLLLIVAGAYLLSKNKKEINWKSVGLAFVAQIVLAFVMIKTPLWKVVELLATMVTWLIAQASAGIEFVFGDLYTGSFIFVISSLMPIVFISAIIGLFYHFGLIQKFVSFFGKTVAKVFNVDGIVATNLVTNMFLGQTESLFVTKSYMPNVKDSVIFATLVAGMNSISVSVFGLYASYGASVEWIIVSLPLSVFSSMILCQLIMPTKHNKEEEIVIDSSEKGENCIDTMMSYASTGWKSVVGISVALMVFLSLIAMVNNLFAIIGIPALETILGYVFYPFSLLMGVPDVERLQVAQILATKLVTNEAVSFGLPAFAELSVRAKAMTTVANCAFSGIGSVGILMGGYSAIAPNKVKVVARLGFKALICATFASIMSGAVVALFL